MNHYEKKFINRGKDLSKKERTYDIGNGFSLSGSRACGHCKCKTRIAEKKFCMDVQKFHTIDLKVALDRHGDLHRKSLGKLGVALKQPCTNLQNHSFQLTKPVKKNRMISFYDYKKIQPTTECVRCISVDTSPYKRITVTDVNHMQTFLDNHQSRFRVDLIVCFGQFANHLEKRWAKLIHSSMDENDPNLKWKSFRIHFDQLSQEIEQHRHILIVCQKAVNRSVALLMYYLITRCSYTYNQALSLIESEKAKKDLCWNNLTNNKLKNFLRCCKSSTSYDANLIDADDHFDRYWSVGPSNDNESNPLSLLDETESEMTHS